MPSDFSPHGTDLFGDQIRPKVCTIAERFTMVPFSILNAREGDWQNRKRAWLALGIKSEIGRGENLAFNTGLKMYENETGDGKAINENTSVFDPVLTEALYRWFCPEEGQIIDPFAGGSVRGIVAGCLGRKYWGCELREIQVQANREQAIEVNPDLAPEWIAGDSRLMMSTAPDADFVFSCPPYGDLEVYSDDPRDISGMKWPDFLKAYREIIALSVMRMKPDSFACFVVADFRDPRGIYRNFVSETISAFIDAGCGLYNEAILVTPVGTAAMRVTAQFTNSRKLAKTHQNVLVFVKGDPKIATQKCLNETEKVESEE